MVVGTSLPMSEGDMDEAKADTAFKLAQQAAWQFWTIAPCQLLQIQKRWLATGTGWIFSCCQTMKQNLAAKKKQLSTTKQESSPSVHVSLCASYALL